MSRARRILILKELLAQSPASTQEALVAGLSEAGIEVTQATVSRDLAAIGAVRGSEGYRLTDSSTAGSSPPGDPRDLRGVLRDHVTRITPAASIVVLHTAPGHANFVASEIDSIRPDGMVGCIAGDDTIFIATQSDSSAASLATQLSTVIEEDS